MSAEEPPLKRPRLANEAAQAETKTDETIEQVLRGLSTAVKDIRWSTDRRPIRRVPAELDGTLRDCFFVTDGSIKFRHNGDDSLTPDLFFLSSRKANKYKQKVLVEFSASGSGKTVDLAGSALARGLDLAVVISMDDTKEKNVTNTDKRNEASMVLLRDKLKKVMSDTVILKQLVSLASSDRALRINLAIDEASRCPKLVRSIIADQTAAGEAVAEALMAAAGVSGVQAGEAGKYVEVSFSVAGTGANTGSVGSNTKNFEPLEPSAKGFTEKLCTHFLGKSTFLMFPGETEETAATYALIKDKLPVVAALMENGRMASIAAGILKKAGSAPVKEATLVDQIITAYLESNGMKDLVGDEDVERKHMVAACALAVHLFQWPWNGKCKTPKDGEEFQTFMAEMKCGVEFSEYVEECVTEGLPDNAVQAMVRQFGLLEPSFKSTRLQPGGIATNLFEMKPAQQLVAIAMLGLSASSFLDPTPYGFETLSTHVAKCAIASASVIDQESRPTLKDVFTKIGFKLDPKATSSAVKKAWDSLDEYQIVEHSFEGTSGTTPADTRQMQVELELCVDDEGNDLLQICNHAFKTLQSMKANDEGSKKLPALPSAWTNFGASPLADGFVTFFCRKVTPKPKKQGRIVTPNPRNPKRRRKATSPPNPPFKFTLEDQAKDYHNGSRLSIKKLNEHAERCSDASLNGVFGKDRLLCVAASSNVLFAKATCTQTRDFIPYAFDKGEILSELLETLEEQRNVKSRVETNATFCDANGTKVSI